MRLHNGPENLLSTRMAPFLCLANQGKELAAAQPTRFLLAMFHGKDFCLLDCLDSAKCLCSLKRYEQK